MPASVGSSVGQNTGNMGKDVKDVWNSKTTHDIFLITGLVLGIPLVLFAIWFLFFRKKSDTSGGFSLKNFKLGSSFGKLSLFTNIFKKKSGSNPLQIANLGNGLSVVSNGAKSVITKLKPGDINLLQKGRADPKEFVKKMNIQPVTISNGSVMKTFTQTNDRAAAKMITSNPILKTMNVKKMKL